MASFSSPNKRKRGNALDWNEEGSEEENLFGPHPSTKGTQGAGLASSPNAMKIKQEPMRGVVPKKKKKKKSKSLELQQGETQTKEAAGEDVDRM